jgi:hypothetical protein
MPGSNCITKYILSDSWLHYFCIVVAEQNLGNLLLKEWLEQPLTETERAYLAVWDSERSVRMAAFGVYCQHARGPHAPVEYIRQLLTAKK